MTTPTTTDPLTQLAHLKAQNVPFVVVTVAAASGGVPAPPGAKMLVTRATLHGTVGGGKVEAAALRHARAMLDAAQPTAAHLQQISLVQDLGMSCGGSVTLFYEPIAPPPRLVIFGAGHIAQPLCTAARLADFHVTVCDERADWLTDARFGAAQKRILAPFDQSVKLAELSLDCFVVCVSPGHTFDSVILSEIFRLGFMPRYIGVIGSQRKGIVLKKELRANGFSAEQVDPIRIPVGLNLGAKTPNEIAISILGELIAVRHGKLPISDW